MQILIKEQGNEYVLVDGWFKCNHLNVEVSKLCCNGYECGCGGDHGVYCPDCKNKDLTYEDIERLFNE